MQERARSEVIPGAHRTFHIKGKQELHCSNEKASTQGVNFVLRACFCYVLFTFEKSLSISGVKRG
jgi:hypothetical protein